MSFQSPENNWKKMDSLKKKMGVIKGADFQLPFCVLKGRIC